MKCTVKFAGIRHVACLAAIVFTGGCDRGQSVDSSQGSSPSSQPAANQAAHVEQPQFALTAEEFATEYHGDLAKARRKYSHALIEISGVVKDVQFDAAGKPWINLKVGSELTGVQCFTKDPNPWEQVANNQEVKLRGVWPELSMSPSLRECEFVEVGPSTAISMTAQQLADEYGADFEGAIRKYTGKTLIVTGEVYDKTMQGIEHWLMLKGNTDVQIRCEFSTVAREGKVIAAIEGGQHVKIWGELLSLNPKKNEAVLSPSRLIK